MKRVLAPLLLLAPLFLASAEEAPVAVRAARLLDVVAGGYVESPVVVVRGGRIESVGKEAPPGARVLDVGDRVLLPGLIDAHTHVLLQGDATQAEYEEQILMKEGRVVRPLPPPEPGR
jgi:imidazolonepropionase-like amidohydrolase